jgi:hypothetical protein
MSDLRACLGSEAGLLVVEWYLILIGLVVGTMFGVHYLVPFVLAHLLASGLSAASLVAASAGGYGAVKQARSRRYHLGAQRQLLAAQAAWNDLLSPGEEGPFDPEEGYELWVPTKRRELPGTSVPGLHSAGMSIRFLVSQYVFLDGQWQQRLDDATRAALVKSHSLPATTDLAELASAWFDFCQEVKERNAARWQQICERRLAADQQERELAEQYAVAELLPGGKTVDDRASARLAPRLDAR